MQVLELEAWAHLTEKNIDWKKSMLSTLFPPLSLSTHHFCLSCPNKNDFDNSLV